MDSPIIRRLSQIFVRNGFAVLRFNFRSVGRSQGRTDNGTGELADAAAALDWLQTNNPSRPQCWIAGYSFGAWIGMQLLMRRPEVAGFILIAPPANIYDFSFLSPCPSSGLIVHGGSDRVAQPQAVRILANRLKEQKGITITHKEIPRTNHIFHNRLPAMEKAVEGYLTRRMAEASSGFAPLQAAR